MFLNHRSTLPSWLRALHLSGLTALLLAAGCAATSGADDTNQGDEEEEPTPQISQYMENGFPTILPENEDYEGQNSAQNDEFFPGFVKVDREDRDVDYRQFLGYITIVDLSAEWCPPCRAAAETAQELYDTLLETGPVYYVQVLGQDNYGNPADAETARRWSSDFDITTMPVLADETDEMAARLQLTGWPTFWIVGPDGRILRRTAGAMPDEQILSWVEYGLDQYDEQDFRHIPGWHNIDAEFD